jgi:ribonuclease HI
MNSCRKESTGIHLEERGVGLIVGVDLFTDGACRGNPGPGGWGVLLRWGRVEKELFGGELETTNNRMELTAVIMALNALTRAVPVALHTDSKYVQQGITQWIFNWRKNGWRTSSKEPVKNVDLWQQLDEVARAHSVDWRWVKGHAGHRDNERADALANRGLETVLASKRR